jgi:hypothetical protein
MADGWNSVWHGICFAHTCRDEASDEVIRLISAQKAITRERRVYAKSQKRSRSSINMPRTRWIDLPGLMIQPGQVALDRSDAASSSIPPVATSTCIRPGLSKESSTGKRIIRRPP